MAAEYYIRLTSSGSPAYTIVYPLETEGGLSTPRLIEYTSLDGNYFVLNDDLTYRFTPAFTFAVTNAGTGGSPLTSANGTYTVASSSFHLLVVNHPKGHTLDATAGTTPFTVNVTQQGVGSPLLGSPLPSVAEVTQITTTDGSTLTLGVSGSPGTPGDYFTINSPRQEYYIWYNVDGTTVDPALGGDKRGVQVGVLSTDTAMQVAQKTARQINLIITNPGSPYDLFRVFIAVAGTIIPVNEAIPTDALPYGQIQYNISNSTTLELPGRGTINYGETLLTNLVHMLEHFAHTAAPNDPLTGQLWFDVNGGVSSPLEGAINFYSTSGIWTPLLSENVSDTIYLRLDATNDPVTGNLQLTQDLQVDGYVGINNVPPTGSTRLEVTGNVQVNSQFFGGLQNTSTPTYSFTGDPDTGIWSSGADILNISTLGVERLEVDGTSIDATVPIGTVNGTEAIPAYSFTGDPDTGMWSDGIGALNFSSNGTRRFTVESNGTLNVANTANYETLVTLDNDIPNKKYVDDAITTEIGSPISFLLLDTSNDPLTGTLTINGQGSPQLALVANGDIEMNSQMRGSNGNASRPTYSFTGDPDTGMWSDGVGALNFSSNGTLRFIVESDGTLNVANTANYETLVTLDDDIPNKKYVDDLITNAFWREPVVVKDDTIYPSVAAAQTVVNTGSIQGVSISNGDRILFTGILSGSPPTARNVYIVSGIPPAATLVEDANTETHGDVVYVIDGVSAGSAYAYDRTNIWSLISGDSGDNGARIDELVDGGSPANGPTVFNTVNVPTVAKTGGKAFIQVFVNGILQKEGGSFAYTVTGSNQITFNSSVPVSADVTIYELI